MKNKALILVLAVVLVFVFIGLSVFFALRGIVAHNKQWAYFDVYRAQAEEYIKASPEITGKYGQNVSVEFDNSVTYSETEPKTYFERLPEIFNPQVPDTLEEFSKGIDMIQFKVQINGNAYEITFEKDDQGEFFVSGLTPSED